MNFIFWKYTRARTANAIHEKYVGVTRRGPYPHVHIFFKNGIYFLYLNSFIISVGIPIRYNRRTVFIKIIHELFATASYSFVHMATITIRNDIKGKYIENANISY